MTTESQTTLGTFTPLENSDLTKIVHSGLDTITDAQCAWASKFNYWTPTIMELG